MGRRKGPKHDHQLKSPNVEHSTEELIAESSVSENLTEAPTTKSPDLEVTACSTETIDVLGNGLVVIKTLRKGLGRETRPSHGDTVVINYKGWLEDGTLVDDVENAKIVLGDGDVIHAFDLSIPLAEHKETFELITDARFAYGSRGRDPDIPSGAKLTYHIEILKVDDPPCYANMPNSERLAIANQKKDRGNYYYRREEFAFAIDSYSKALKILQLPTSSTQSSGEKSDVDCPTELINDAKLKLENNLAAAQLKVEAFDAAIMSCDTVLQSDPQNIKALFRKGKVSCVLFIC
uniref:peptidylprolyl isomerase n=1 Tax=Schistosoma japonicum TaxID=6182 RepID=C1LIJ7_SCHJA|nr:hypotherical protein [Schistosoma japonicum]